ncbi:Uncharacterised protein [Mycobacterium tuberculosis]|nr:Uncharacterised protein [Mycobacterium tuberculosis]
MFIGQYVSQTAHVYHPAKRGDDAGDTAVDPDGAGGDDEMHVVIFK